MNKTAKNQNAVLVTAFGGPEKQDDVIPYLTRVTQGRVPEQRLKAVASHYALFGGKSPVTELTNKQANALEEILKNRGIALPVYVGMRHWNPLLQDTLGTMSRDGIKRAIVVIMSVFQSRASWDQYQEDITKATMETKIDLPVIYARPVFDQPGFLNAMAKRIEICFEQMTTSDRRTSTLVFTAHSIPHADPHVKQYTQQIETSAECIANQLGHPRWKIAYQSRSGRPQDPWLVPDINDMLQEIAAQGGRHVVVAPIGFVCDNIEVLYDLGTRAKETAQKHGLTFLLAKTVEAEPLFINTLADLVIEKLDMH